MTLNADPVSVGSGLLPVVALPSKAGIPDGVLSVVTCSRASVPTVGKELATNRKVRKVSFTGSTAVGKHITVDAVSTMKRVSMELGGTLSPT